MADTERAWDFTGLRAMFLNGTLKRWPEVSNTQGLIELSASIMRRHGVEVEVLRAIDHDIATVMHFARMIEGVGGIPACGNSRSEWDKGERFGFVQPT